MLDSRKDVAFEKAALPFNLGAVATQWKSRAAYAKTISCSNVKGIDKTIEKLVLFKSSAIVSQVVR